MVPCGMHSTANAIAAGGGVFLEGAGRCATVLLHSLATPDVWRLCGTRLWLPKIHMPCSLFPYSATKERRLVSIGTELIQSRLVITPKRIR